MKNKEINESVRENYLKENSTYLTQQKLETIIKSIPLEMDKKKVDALYNEADKLMWILYANQVDKIFHQK